MNFDALIAKAKKRRSLPAPAQRRAIREASSLSQQHIADALGVDRAVVSRWESEDRVVPRGTMFDAYVELLERLQLEVLTS